MISYDRFIFSSIFLVFESDDILANLISRKCL